MRLYCNMVDFGGGWTLVAKANANRAASEHRNRQTVNAACLATTALNCAGTVATDFRIAVGTSRFNWITCGVRSDDPSVHNYMSA